ncbi:MAG: T9SS type A sorting domain-containing protein [Candidatus Cloacimonetes bacterium]|nr:T9SS type A sorting domain-containing protein [Candidatus Cloacimonadota bacterium]
MKRLSLLLVLNLFVFLNGQQEWGDYGATFTNNTFIDWKEGAVAVGDDIIVTWGETGELDFDIYACRYNSEGESVWEEPVVVCSAYGIQRDPHIISSSDGNFIISWYDYRDPYFYRDDPIPELYLQKIDGWGNMLWEEGGICTNYAYGDIQSIIPDASGGCLAAFLSSYHEIQIRNYDINGNLNEEIGIISEPFSSYIDSNNNLRLFSNDGDFFLFWNTYSGESPLNINRYSFSGALVWSNNYSYLVQDDNPVKESAIIDVSLYMIYTAENLNYLKEVDLITGLQSTEDMTIPTLANAYEFKLTSGGIFVFGSADGQYNMSFYDYDLQLLNDEYLYDSASYYGRAYVCGNDEIELMHIENDRHFHYSRFSASGELEELCYNIAELDHDVTDGKLLAGESATYFAFENFGVQTAKMFFMAKPEESIFGDFCEISEGKTISSFYCDPFITDRGLFINCDRKVLTLQGFDDEGNTIFEQPGFDMGERSSINNASYYDENANVFLQSYSTNTGNQYALWLNGALMDDEPEYLWGEDGLLITSTSQKIMNIQISGLAENDYLVVWKERYGGNTDLCRIFAQQVCNGSLVWDEAGITLLTLPEEYSEVYSIENYIFLGNPEGIYVTRIDENGNWAEGWDGFLHLNSDYFLPEDKISYSLTDIGLKLVWVDDISKIKAQIITPEGGLIFGDDNCTLIEDADMSLFSKQVVFEDDHTYICYSDHQFLRYSVWDDVFNLQYEQATATDKMPTNMVKAGNYFLMTRNNGGMYEDDYLDLFALDLEGNPAAIMESNPTIIIDEWWQTWRTSLLIKDGFAYVTWLDERCVNGDIWESDPRGGNGVYAQKVSLNITAENNDLILPSWQLAVYPNPFNPSINISWSLEQISEDAVLNIYNVKGQKVQEYGVKERKGHFTWNGRDKSEHQCASGIYLIRLQNGKEEKTAKVLLMK